MLQQNGNRLEGTHQGDFVLRDISGTASRDAVSMTSIVTERHGDALTYRFTGRVAGETLSGVLDLGEYRTASWTGRRLSAG
jgi:L-seryl-tRNA(Ser) seleniumtransferase